MQVQPIIPGRNPLAGAPVEPAALEYVVLSYGMGVESTAILLRWLEDPSSRDFELSQLIVIVAMTGDEHESTRRAVLEKVLPRLRAAGVRLIQVGRAGPREKDGVLVLDDSRAPERLLIEGAWKLSQELEASGTVPQYANGQRKCSIKAKGIPLDTLVENLFGPWKVGEVPKVHTGAVLHRLTKKQREKLAAAGALIPATRFRHVIGFNSEEMKRVERDQGYTTVARLSEYPLVTWGWNRAKCEEYLLALTGIHWPKSCCTYCPFAGGKCAAMERMKQEPTAGLQALRLEHVALALNPRSTLYSGKSLWEKLGQKAPEIVRSYEAWAAEQRWALYRVRRVFSRKGKAMRSVRQLFQGSLAEVQAEFTRRARAEHAEVEGEGLLRWGHIIRKAATSPGTEEILALCPAVVKDKERKGFAEKWAEHHPPTQRQLPLQAA